MQGGECHKFMLWFKPCSAIKFMYRVIFLLEDKLSIYVTTVFVDTQLWKTKHPRKRFQKLR